MSIEAVSALSTVHLEKERIFFADTDWKGSRKLAAVNWKKIKNNHTTTPSFKWKFYED